MLWGTNAQFSGSGYPKFPENPEDISQTKLVVAYPASETLEHTFLGGEHKRITIPEMELIFKNGMKWFPIFQKSGNSLSYFNAKQGSSIHLSLPENKLLSIAIAPSPEPIVYSFI